MRVGVYIDGFNVYYGGRDCCGGSTPGWRWLNVRSLAEDLIARRTNLPGATIERVVYCTARIDAATNPQGQQEQDIYLKALRTGGIVDHIEYGHYVSRVKKAPLATPDKSGRPILTKSAWPVMVRDGRANPIKDAGFMVSYAYREEKGSDVNVGAHLLLDTLEGRVDVALVISNDSDLRFPVEEARRRVPVGTVNPSQRYNAGVARYVSGRGWPPLVGKTWPSGLPEPSASGSMRRLYETAALVAQKKTRPTRGRVV